MPNETHSLTLKVDSTQIKKGKDDLDSLSQSAGKAEGATAKTTQSFFSLGKVLSSLAILGTAQQFIKMADTMTGIESKLKLVTKNTLDLTIAQQELFEIAQKTRQGYSETVDIYSNFATSMGEMGKSQKDILRVTETVNKAIAISGGTAQQAAAATMQLGQAFASGTLRGDELNSILENSKGLAQAIADGMGVPIGELRTLGSEGKITAEVLAKALEKSAQSVDEKFDKVGVTVSASLVTVGNALLDIVGITNGATGATEGLAKMFVYLGKKITDNKADIVEFGKDSLRVVQLSGTGIMLFGTQLATFFNNIPYGVTLLIDTLSIKTEQAINSMLGGTESAINKLKGLFGGDKISLGRVDISTDLSKDYKASSDYLANLSKDLITTSDKLTKDIATMTTVVSKKVEPSDKKGDAKGSSGKGETDEEREARLKAIEDAEKARLKALDDEWAKLQKIADGQKKYDDDQFEMQKKKTDAIEQIRVSSLSETDAINEKMLALIETSGLAFDDERLTEFYKKWQEEIDKTTEKMEEFNFGMSLSFDVSGLEGTPKALASMGNSFEDLADIEKQYQENKVKYAGNAEALAKNEQENTQLQGIAYANLAGAMSNMFEKGSSGAKAFSAIQATLGIINAYTAITNAMATPPAPVGIALGAKVAALALPIVGILASLGGSSGGGGGGKKAPDYTQTIKSASYATGKGVSIKDYGGNFEKFIEGLDSASAKLEGFGSTGSALGEKLKALSNSFNSELETWAKWSVFIFGGNVDQRKNEIYQSVISGNFNNSLSNKYKEISTILTEAVQESLDYALLSKDSLSALVNDIDLNAYEDTLRKVNDLALKAKSQGGILSPEDKKALLELYTLPNFIKAQDYKDAIDIYKKYIEDEKDLTLDRFDNLGGFVDSVTDFVKELKGLGSSQETFGTFSTSFTDMVNAITSGSDDIEKIGDKAIDSAKAYLSVVGNSATSAKEIEFSKLLVAARFQSVGGIAQTSLTNINDTLLYNLGSNGEIVKKLSELTLKIDDLNKLNIAQVDTGLNTLSAIRSTL